MVHGHGGPGQRRRRFLSSFGAALVVAGVFAGLAFATATTISDGWVSTAGVYGPRHSLSRVYVHSWNYTGNGACEDAELSPEHVWAQERPWCIDDGAVWVDFCACRYMIGWNWGSIGTEYMTGHEDW
jgi:hypothetical protein